MDTEDVRRLLEQEKSRLEQVRDSFDDDHLHDESEDESTSEPAHLGQHMANIGSETFEREKEFSILEEVEAELDDIERALQRLDAGSYGRCEVCHQPIADERLEVKPATRFCVAHQAVAEQRRAAWPEPEPT
ncbi:MAG: TraR/DksA C4-type zinc finger protein [Acidimicrobiales bacterium]